MNAIFNFVKELVQNPVQTVVRAVTQFVTNPVGTVIGLIRDIASPQSGSSSATGGGSGSAGSSSRLSSRGDDADRRGADDRRRREAGERAEAERRAREERFDRDLEQRQDMVIPLPEFDGPLTPVYPNAATLKLIANSSPLAKDVFLALIHEGKPAYLDDVAWLKRFARWGWNEEEDISAQKVLSSWQLLYKGSSLFKPLILQKLETPMPTPPLDTRLQALFEQLSGEPSRYPPNVSDIPEIIANQMRNNQFLDMESVMTLVELAETGDRGAFAALIAVGLANAQNPDEWTNITNVECYTGLGGNCATFVSTVLYLAGITPTDNWNLGIPNEDGVFPGSDDFRTALSVDSSLRSNQLSEARYEGVYNIGYGALYSGVVSFFRREDVDRDGEPDSVPIPPANVYHQLEPGALFVIKGSWNHVALIVGFGPSDGGPNAQFYTTYEQAAAALGSEAVIVPYAVDHGGNNPQGYPRPIGVWADTPSATYIVDLEYTS